MGTKPSSGILMDKTNEMALNQVERNYYKQMYVRNKKSGLKFKEEVYSIIKRLPYLRYRWADELK